MPIGRAEKGGNFFGARRSRTAGVRPAGCLLPRDRSSFMVPGAWGALEASLLLSGGAVRVISRDGTGDFIVETSTRAGLGSSRTVCLALDGRALSSRAERASARQCIPLQRGRFGFVAVPPPLHPAPGRPIWILPGAPAAD